MNNSLAESLSARRSGTCFYGLAPPKQATPAEQLERIVTQQLTRLKSLPIDGLIVYDIQDEAERISIPRPFPFLPTIEPDVYAYGHLRSLAVPKIVYRCVTRDTPESFIRWLQTTNASAVPPRTSVLVGAPSGRAVVSTGHHLHTSAPRCVLEQGRNPLPPSHRATRSDERRSLTQHLPVKAASDRAARDQTVLRSNISRRFRKITIRDGLHPAPLTIHDHGTDKTHQEK
jgi:hypothetical protein